MRFVHKRFHREGGGGRPRRRPALPSVSAPLVGALVGLGACGPAEAAFSVCNQTLDVVNVAIGHVVDDSFTTEGWWTIGSNACATVVRDDLAVRHIFVFAMDVFGRPLLEGTEPMCIGDDKFKIPEGTGDCWGRGYREEKFIDVDTLDQSDWRLFLSEP